MPIYGTRFTLGVLRNKLQEFNLGDTPLIEFKPGDDFDVAGIKVQTLRVTHSIPDACSVAIDTPVGIYLHSGDVKLDPAPVDGRLTDLAKLAEIGEEGVTPAEHGYHQHRAHGAFRLGNIDPRRRCASMSPAITGAYLSRRSPAISIASSRRSTSRWS